MKLVCKRLLLIIVISLSSLLVYPYFVPCPEELGGGLCPLGDTCCPITYDDGSIGSACIPTASGLYNGSCCFDSYTRVSSRSQVLKGCGVGYTCQEPMLHKKGTKIKHENESDDFCQATPDMIDPILQRVPQYHLCYQGMGQYDNDHSQSVFDLHGWSVGVGLAIVPYYSSHGDLSSKRNETSHINDIEYAVIGIHGASRNADDLFCSLLASADHNPSRIDSKNVLIISIRFPITTDLDIYTTITDSGEVLQWDESDGGYGGSWRLGMNAVWPPYAVHISSFDVMDQMIQHLLSFRNLRYISIVGHSAGGQYVQHWSLLTPVWIENRMSSVVSNPSNYAYLTSKRRYYNTTTNQSEWSIPNHTDCPNYNQWFWGLEPDTRMKDNVTTMSTYKVSYLQKAIQSSSSTNLKDKLRYIKQRFASRNVIYLAGKLDHCNISSDIPDPWCISHGLQTTCADMIQGSTRWERHWNYWESLQRIYSRSNHSLKQYRDTVEDVGHDYSLIFNSDVGLKAIYNPYQYTNSFVYTTIDDIQIEAESSNHIINHVSPVKFYIREQPLRYKHEGS